MTVSYNRRLRVFYSLIRTPIKIFLRNILFAGHATFTYKSSFHDTRTSLDFRKIWSRLQKSNQQKSEQKIAGRENKHTAKKNNQQKSIQQKRILQKRSQAKELQ